MPSSILNSDDGVISGTSGLKSSGGDDGVLVFQSKGTETARINTDKQIVAAAGTASLPALTTTGDVNTGIFFPAADTIAFGEGGAEAMRIDSSGNILIGTTSTWGTAGSGKSVYIDNNSDQQTLRISNSDPGSPNYNLVGFYRSKGSLIATISTNNTTVAYNTSSDYRMKENIQPMTDGLAKILELKPCTYTWKVDGSKGEGFIAHELAEVCPQAVTGEKDAVNEDGSIKPQGIDTSFLVATLTAAIQELSAKNDALEARIAALEAVPGNE